MAVYTNDLRLTELATGEGSGTWGSTTNGSLKLIGEALGFATEQSFSSDADATTTVGDGVSDPARAMYFKVTSAVSLTATRTLTIAPNTVSRVMFIENATSGSQSIAISQGSGANVTIATGKTAIVYLDGAGATAAVVDAMAGVDPGVTDTLAEVLTAGNATGGTDIAVGTGDDVTFADSSKAIFGAGSDLSVYHDGSNSYISEAGTGNLIMGAGAALLVKNAALNENLLTAYQNGAVTLYYDNAEKLATTSTGIDVTGTIVGDGLTVDGDPALNGNVTITNTGTGAAAGPYLTLDRNSSSPADSDLIGILSFRGRDDGANATDYGTIAGKIADVTGGTEDGVMLFNVISGGGSRDVLTLSHNESVFNNGSADQDFRVESNGVTHMLFVDGTTNRVGINNSAPDYTLQVGESAGSASSIAISAGGTSEKKLVFKRSSSEDYVLVEDDAENLSLNGPAGLSKEFVINNTSTNLDFRVESDSNANALFVDAGNSRVGINNSSPSKDFDVTGSMNVTQSGGDFAAVFTTAFDYVAKFVSSDSAGFIVLQDSNSTDNANRIGAVGDSIQIESGNVENALFTASASVFNENSADQDFRVESDTNANALHVDAQYSVVGINSNDATTYTTTNSLVINGRDTALVNGVSAGSNLQNFRFWNDTGTAYEVAKWVTNVGAGQVNRAEHSFQVNNGAGLREWLSVDYVGNVVFNDDSNDMDFRVESDANAHAIFMDASTSTTGFGTSSPDSGYRIDVSGGVKASFIRTATTSSGYTSGQTISLTAGAVTESRVYQVFATRHTGTANKELEMGYVYYSGNGAGAYAQVVNAGNITISVSGSTISASNDTGTATLYLTMLRIN